MEISSRLHRDQSAQKDASEPDGAIQLADLKQVDVR